MPSLRRASPLALVRKSHSSRKITFVRCRSVSQPSRHSRRLKEQVLEEEAEAELL